MAEAVVSFNPEHDAAALRWMRRPMDFPLDAINAALERLYRDDANRGNGDLAPYLYEVWSDDVTCLGMLVAGNFNPDNDAEIRAVWDDIVTRDNLAPESDGPFARFAVNV